MLSSNHPYMFQPALAPILRTPALYPPLRHYFTTTERNHALILRSSTSSPVSRLHLYANSALPYRSASGLPLGLSSTQRTTLPPSKTLLYLSASMLSHSQQTTPLRYKALTHLSSQQATTQSVAYLSTSRKLSIISLPAGHPNNIQDSRTYPTLFQMHRRTRADENVELQVNFHCISSLRHHHFNHLYSYTYKDAPPM